MPTSILILLVAVSGILAVLVGLRAHVTRSREGKMLAFVALLIFPAIAVWAGFSEQMDRAQSTKFCLSCHVMSEYGQSLYVDDRSYIPLPLSQTTPLARHHAFSPCHTTYTMYRISGVAGVTGVVPSDAVVLE